MNQDLNPLVHQRCCDVVCSGLAGWRHRWRTTYVGCSGEYRFCRYCPTFPRSARFVASFAGFGRAARSQAAACALVARYCPGASALRPSSREIVDGARPSRAAIDRIDSPAARASAISSRSAKHK